ncbi:MAG: [LysW]-aminoadipate kinase, partial [Ardenticatenia bacterium]|nr:[LysW]-aminoadipate kinase [Ardenticatenia bacterium]
LCPPAISTDHEIINVDGDRAASAVAAALGADTLVLLTGAPGLLRRPDDPASVIPRLHRQEIEDAIEQYARGRMRLKLVAAREALNGGVSRVIIGPSAAEAPVRAALNGRGTTITP